MKIAHLSHAAEQSVINVIRDRAAAAANLGLPIDFYVLNPELEDSDNDNLCLRRERSGSYLRLIHPYAHAPLRIRQLRQYADFGEYDALVLRYPKLPLGSSLFYQTSRRMMITEHHTKSGDEIRSTRSLPRFAAARLEDYLRPRFLSNMAGIIGVTPEITDYAGSDTGVESLTTISNGISVKDIPFSGSLRSDNYNVSIIFVASVFSVWQGLERLLDGLAVYTGSIRVIVTLLGTVNQRQHARIDEVNRGQKNVKVVCPGPRYGEEAAEYFANQSVAVSTLSLFKKNMREACPLKTREYVARGLPFVYAYDDPDIPDNVEFALKLPATDRPVDIEQVVDFCQRVGERTDVSHQMRCFAEKNLDWTIKTQQMYDFVTSVVD